MITNTTKAEELIRAQITEAERQIAGIDEQIKNLQTRRAQLTAVLDEWKPVIADD